MNLSVNANQLPIKNLRKSVIAGSIGVLVHWFDWALYAYMASTIALVFFPAQDATASLLAVFGVFAVSFIVRPLGAFLFGELGDRFGRKKTLSIVILLMAGSSLAIGFLPGFVTIGIWAPILLLVARVIQGLAAGGEFGSAATFLAEYSPRKYRGFGVSWLEVGALLGFLLASLVAYLMSLAFTAETLVDWAWRIPFFIAGPLGLIGFYIRQHIEDTPEFQVLESSEQVSKSPTKDVLQNNLKQLFQMIGIQMMMQVTFYIVLVYLLTYQEVELGISAQNAALFSVLASLIGVFIVPLAGIASDFIGRKPIMILSAILTIALAWPMFGVMGEDFNLNLIATVALGAVLALQLGVHAVQAAEMFPTRNRQTALSIGYSIVSACFSGTVPYVMTYFIAKTGNIMMPAYYLILVGVIGLIAALTIPETKGTELLSSEEVERAQLFDLKLVGDE